jgi:FHA domain
MAFLKQIEKALDQRLRSIFGGSGSEPGAREAVELYRDALDQISARASVGKRGDRIFPFDLIRIELMATTPERKAVLETLFEPGQMVDDIRASLLEERVTAPRELAVQIHFPPEAAAELRVICEKAAGQLPESREQAGIPATPAKLIAKSGVASAEIFSVERPHVNIGRVPEVVDSVGRPVRRNDLHFPEGADEANSTVSRSHAHLRFDSAGGEWRIYDDGSSLGTSIFREGRRIEVPAHASRGVALRPGDEIYLGQACLLFE